MFLAPEGVLLWGGQGKERSRYLRRDSMELSLLGELYENAGYPEFLFYWNHLLHLSVSIPMEGWNIRTQR